MTIKEARLKLKLTQSQASAYVSIPLRTYSRYENNKLSCSEIKKNYILSKLEELSKITETKGILTLQQIKFEVEQICKNNEIALCILFGSYAKGSQTERSDVDLLIETNKKGLAFYGLVEEFHSRLYKKIDLIRIDDALSNKDLMMDILKEGIKIYG